VSPGRRSVEHTAGRIVLFVWVSIAALGSVAGERDGRLTLRVVAVLVVAVVTVEGARWLAATIGPPVRPVLPLVRMVRPEPSRVPARLQSWVALMRAAEGDPHVGPLLRERLSELARARGGRPLPPDVPLDVDRLEPTIAAMEALDR
jgi:hypothetical protein